MKNKEELAFEKGYRVLPDGSVCSPKGRILSRNNTDRDGYPQFRFEKGCTYIPVHRLAAYQKFGKRLYDPGIEVRHRRNDPSNSRPCNILIGTRSQNSMDKSRATRVRVAKIAAAARRSLTDTQVDQLRKDRDGGMSYLELMAKYEIAKSTVSYIVRRKTYA
jgi:hypothetical protein